MQAPYYCTGVEAGAVAFKQIIQKYNQEEKSLFRAGATANVIFISDTHDPGNDKYYGKNGAPFEIPTFENINALVLENSPDIKLLRFSGIVPLPKIGSIELEGLTVIGGIPLTDEEAYINGEGTNGYSYFDFIKKSMGVAVHAKRDNWNEAMSELIKNTVIPQTQVVKLSQPAGEIVRVIVNGKELMETEWRFQDKQTIVILIELDPEKTHSIQVEYFPED